LNSATLNAIHDWAKCMKNDVSRFLPMLSVVSAMLILCSTCLQAQDGDDPVAMCCAEMSTEGRPHWYGPRVTVGVPSGIGDEPEYYVEIAAGRNLSWPEAWTLLHFCEPELLFGVANMWDEDDEHIFSFSAGPAITMRPFGENVVLDIGSRPTYMSGDEFTAVNLGGQFYFVSHIGLRLRLGDQFEFGARLQHLSNASIESPNPGLEVFGVELVFRPR
jgi:hypothetical protein